MSTGGEIVPYETQADFSNEERVAKILAEKWRCEMQRNKPLSAFDYIAHRGGKPTAFVELRRRSVSFHKYPTVIVSILMSRDCPVYLCVNGLMRLAT
jgi:hypothetical protein